MINVGGKVSVKDNLGVGNSSPTKGTTKNPPVAQIAQIKITTIIRGTAISFGKGSLFFLGSSSSGSNKVTFSRDLFSDSSVSS